MTYEFHIDGYSFEYSLSVKMCVTKFVLTSSLARKSMIVNYEVHCLFSKLRKVILNFVLSLISSII